MNTVSTLIMSGLIIAFAAQVAGAIISFRTSALQGLLALIIPGYLFVVLRRSGAYSPIVGVWLLGVALLVGGTVVSS